MRPLLEFRDVLAETTDPDKKSNYRNFKRRTGKVSYARDDLQDDSEENRVKKHVPGPYWMSYRREWLESLLNIQKLMQDEGRDEVLITESELHEIRREWLLDPNEPDWED